MVSWTPATPTRVYFNRIYKRVARNNGMVFKINTLINT